MALVEVDRNLFPCLTVDVRNGDFRVLAILIRVLIGLEIIALYLILIRIFGSENFLFELCKFSLRPFELCFDKAFETFLVGNDVGAH